MKPYQQIRKPKRKVNKMDKEVKQEATEQLPKWRQWVKDNKGKLLAVIGVGLSAIGGDVVGITDFITAWFF